MNLMLGERVTDADTDDKNVPDLNVEHIVVVRGRARVVRRGKAFHFCSATRGKD